ncbi:hypothetical protein SUGI_0264540 [Cryptomeria japonica]|uniref:uncharacterized protein LOC131070442 n=1 Tax=Cryptomeria japonica TaxID=3369 RepID=UPI002408E3E3|nr:uncharacterized protein LOC131070442 [Cryptomeria japonica]GLJ15980.1 hypothetical protein SUGI_0264540 [Cryptomeria japonica]
MVIKGVGWPLGLETVNIRVEIMNGIRAMERTPFHLTTPSSSSLSSSNLDTESSTSFFTERSTTLGNLIGITPTQHTSGNVHSEELRWMSTNGRRAKNNGKMRSWRLLIGCTDMNIDESAVSKTDNNNAPSLRDLLEAQRSARTVEENVYINVMYEASELEITPLLLGGQGIPESLNTREFCATGMPSIEDISVNGSILNILSEN